MRVVYRREGEGIASRIPERGGMVISPDRIRKSSILQMDLWKAYKEFFDFKEAPFSVSPAPKFFYASASHAEALDHLRYGIYEGLGFTMVVGEPGTGKTMLARYFMSHAGEDLRIIHLSDPRVSPRELLVAVLEGLGEARFPPEESTERKLTGRLGELLLLANNQSKRVVVIMDEAQGLGFESLEGLRLLSNLETEKGKLIHIVLFGQTELEENLRERQLRQFDQRILVRYRLRPLEREEIRPYIEHQLTTAKGDPNLEFYPQSTDKIHEISGGLPRAVNALCERAMMAAFQEDTRKITVQHILEGWESLEGIKILERRRF
jgi:general secretion pathway protein A